MSIFSVLDVNISVTNLKHSSEQILMWVRDKVQSYVCVAPVSTIVFCQKDGKYKEIVNGANMVTPDGMPVVWLGKLQGFKQVSRTYGPDLMALICEKGQAQGVRHFFYGATNATLDILQKELKLRYPQIVFAGAIAPECIEVGQKEDLSIIEKINNASPDIIWVALGSPKQDYWMFNHRKEIQAPVMVGVGAAFDFVAGIKPQAPRWMQKSGLEWFFRLCSEPKRLWRRYLIGNTIFIFLLMKNFIKNLLWRT